MQRFSDYAYGNVPFHQKKRLESEKKLSELKKKLQAYTQSLSTTETEDKKISLVVKLIYDQIQINIHAQEQNLAGIKTSIQSYRDKSRQLIGVINTQIEEVEAQIANAPEESSQSGWFSKSPLEKLEQEKASLKQEKSELETEIEKINKPEEGIVETAADEKSSTVVTDQALDKTQLKADLANLKTSVQTQSQEFDLRPISKSIDNLPTAEQISELAALHQKLEQLQTKLLEPLQTVTPTLAPTLAPEEKSLIEVIQIEFKIHMDRLVDQTQFVQPKVATLITEITDWHTKVEQLKLDELFGEIKTEVQELPQLTEYTSIVKQLANIRTETAGPIAQEIIKAPFFAEVLSPEQDYGQYPEASKSIKTDNETLESVQLADTHSLSKHYKSAQRLKNSLEAAPRLYRNYYDSLTKSVGKAITSLNTNYYLRETKPATTQLDKLKLLFDDTKDKLSSISSEAKEAAVDSSSPSTKRRKQPIQVEFDAEENPSSKKNQNRQLKELQDILNHQQHFAKPCESSPDPSELKTTEEKIESTRQCVDQNWINILDKYCSGTKTDNDELNKIREKAKQLRQQVQEENQLLSYTDVATVTARYELAKQTLQTTKDQLASIILENSNLLGQLKAKLQEVTDRKDDLHKKCRNKIESFKTLDLEETENIQKLEGQIREQEAKGYWFNDQLHILENLKESQLPILKNPKKSKAVEASASPHQPEEKKSTNASSTHVLKQLTQQNLPAPQQEQQYPRASQQEQQSKQLDTNKIRDALITLVNNIQLETKNRADGQQGEALLLSELREKPSTVQSNFNLEKLIKTQTAIAILEVMALFNNSCSENDMKTKLEEQTNRANKLINNGLDGLKIILENNPHPDQSAKGKKAIESLHAEFKTANDNISAIVPSDVHDPILQNIYQLIAKKALHHLAKNILTSAGQIAEQRQKAIGVNLKYSLSGLWQSFCDFFTKLISRSSEETLKTSGARRHSLYAQVSNLAKTTLDADNAVDHVEAKELDSRHTVILTQHNP